MSAESQAFNQPLCGTVLAVQANFYQVRLDPTPAPTPYTLHPSPFLLCTRRSRLKKLGQRVMVGDRVQIEEPDWQGGRGAISQVLPRHSELDRPPVANANQILLVFALAEPALDPHQLSRFLVKAESTGLNVCLCLSKCDLVTAEVQAEWRSRLNGWGYEPIFISVRQQEGLEQLAEPLNQQITVVSGPSGVGKSSLINYLVPQVNLRVSEVSGKLARGRHTTRHVELFELPVGGLLADTPGFNQPELQCRPEELADCFPEARHRLAAAACQFSDCLHRNDPGCVVRGDWERYDHYLTLLAEAIAHWDALGQTSNEETNLKLKSRQGGSELEPKLELKKYRRQSRRSQQQELLALQQDEEAGMRDEG